MLIYYNIFHYIFVLQWISKKLQILKRLKSILRKHMPLEAAKNSRKSIRLMMVRSFYVNIRT